MVHRSRRLLSKNTSMRSAPPPLAALRTENEDLQSLVKAMDYNAGWMTSVNRGCGTSGRIGSGGMDASGISVAILSHTVPGAQGIVDPSAAAAAARDINDFVLPQRSPRSRPAIAGFASVALHDPEAARARARARRHSPRVEGRDDQRLHQHGGPQRRRVSRRAAGCCRSGRRRPHSARRFICIRGLRSISASYEGHGELIGATWGFAPETATHALRLVYSGLFDRFPRSRVILGHLGETLPVLRVAHPALLRIQPGGQAASQRRLQDYLCDNFYVSTSGFFSDQALIGALLTDRRRPHPVCLRLSLRD